MRESDRYEISQYKGRNRRLLYEWQQLERRLEHRHDITCRPVRRNKEGLPTAYQVGYQLRSISGVENIEHFGEPGVENPPVFATGFHMRIDLPDGYPSVDAAPVFRFLTHDEYGQPIPHPWHPNIRYSGDFAGRVCLNAMDTHAGLAWAVERVESYLRYERYHALNEAPYPEDQRVAAWVIREGEPNDWIVF